MGLAWTSRWLSRNPEYTFLLGEITRAVTSRIRMLRHATDADRERWGIAYVRETVARWEREERGNDGASCS